MIECSFEDGHIANPKLRHMGVEAIVMKDGKILMVKRAMNLYKEPGKWGIIGGHVGHGETMSQAIEREILEETGYEIQNLNLLTIIDNPRRRHDENQVVAAIYFCQAGEKIGEPDTESTEQRWFDLNNLPPLEQIAFDHLDNINLYKRYLKERFKLPYDKL